MYFVYPLQHFNSTTPLIVYSGPNLGLKKVEVTSPFPEKNLGSLKNPGKVNQGLLFYKIKATVHFVWNVMFY